MAKKIFKYTLKLVDRQALTLPGNATVLSVITQHDQLQLYALVEPSAVCCTPIEIYIIGTGNPIPEMFGLQYATFLGTCKMADDQLIWHIFYQQVE